MEVFFFAPHQDDELTNLGIELCRAVDAGHSIHAVLCTDGGASSVKRMLINGGGCAWHPGDHHYSLTGAAFTAARDAEYNESCRALGVAAENIIISPLRGHDGGLTKENALAIMREAMRGYDPAGCAAVTIAPMPRLRQNPDHTAVGEAAKALFAAGGCAELKLLWEFILLPPEADRAGLRQHSPTPAQFERIKKAAAAYRRWAPAEGRYAVGYHSVADEFDDFLRTPICVEKGTLVR